MSKNRETLEAEAAERLSAARCRLVTGPSPTHAFFACLALDLPTRPDWDCPTACTDGREIRYNPAFIMSLSKPEVIGVYAHELQHPALLHHTRIGLRDPLIWNLAADCAINPLLKSDGLVLPKGGLFPETFGLPPNLSAEEYYALLQKKAVKADGMGMGGVVAPPGGGSSPDEQAAWKGKVARAAAAARQQGKLPAGLERMIDEVLHPKVPWRDVLFDFAQTQAKNEYMWAPPARRYMSQGLYLPRLKGVTIADMVVAIDTSGSIGQNELSLFAGSLEGIAAAVSAKLTILYCDAEIAGVETWEQTDGPLVLKPKGGGGTSHLPVFEYIEKHGLTPSGLICFTDLYTSFPKEGPEYPVLWAVVGNSNPTAPFGRVIVIDDE